MLILSSLLEICNFRCHNFFLTGVFLAVNSVICLYTKVGGHEFCSRFPLVHVGETITRLKNRAPLWSGARACIMQIIDFPGDHIERRADQIPSSYHAPTSHQNIVTIHKNISNVTVQLAIFKIDTISIVFGVIVCV